MKETPNAKAYNTWLEDTSDEGRTKIVKEVVIEEKVKHYTLWEKLLITVNNWLDK